ncbi:MAG: trypsin-like peptidase domain-containing protein [Verrucomicrobiota bacterium]
MKFLLHLIATGAALLLAAGAYWLLIDKENRYDVFDLLARKPFTATTPLGSGSSLVAQAEMPQLRAEPLEIAQTGLLEQVNDALSNLTDAVVPSVVSIDTTTNVQRTRVVRPSPFSLFGYRQSENYEAPGLGSGVIVSNDGYIVTNHHVVAGVDKIRVTLHDESEWEAEWIGSDPNVDVAVLKLVAPEGGSLPTLQPLPFGDSDQVRVGEMVLAVGNPFGLNETVTRGIISAKQRELNDGANEYFQVDAVINPGNSGGPLVNVRGEIIGINVAIFTGQQDVRVWQGIGLAIPAREVREVFEAVVLGRPLIRGYLGVELTNLTTRYALATGLNSTAGAVITQVAAGSPADDAALKPGDVILQFDGKEVKSAEDALARIRGKKRGEVAELTLVRQGEVLKAAIEVAAKSDTNTLKLRADVAKNGQAIAEAIGIRVGDLAVEERSSYGLPGDVPAVIVTEVIPGALGEAQFSPGDLIHRVNQDDATDAAVFYDLLGSLPQDQTSVILFSRQGRVLRALLRP